MAPMTAATATVPPAALSDALGALRDREHTAQRLLQASARHSFDPDTELDWDADWVEGKWFTPPELCSLYGTPLWDGMSPEQRMDLSRHEAAQVAASGIWFETILMQLLVRHAYDCDLTSGHVRYALTEIADECRHSMMFARLVDKMATPDYAPRPLDHQLGRVLKTASTATVTFAAALCVEEILDWNQRLTFSDERVQPLLRGATRIHVVEEARHVRYAREELRRQLVAAPRWERAVVRLVTAEVILAVMRTLGHPRVYAAVGLDPRLAAQVARQSPHRRLVLQRSAERVVAFFTEIGVIRGATVRAAWRRAQLLP
ncbi:diiron oxygenase [Streptomyces sp. NPDC001941]|uniref:AurF N-oxygenase family protein n=1 Tax=Streptomyces sp. NPDC001941 TaxID=3154659 RepID=UPI00331E155A